MELVLCWTLINPSSCIRILFYSIPFFLKAILVYGGCQPLFKLTTCQWRPCQCDQFHTFKCKQQRHFFSAPLWESHTFCAFVVRPSRNLYRNRKGGASGQAFKIFKCIEKLQEWLRSMVSQYCASQHNSNILSSKYSLCFVEKKFFCEIWTWTRWPGDWILRTQGH